MTPLFTRTQRRRRIVTASAFGLGGLASLALSLLVTPSSSLPLDAVVIVVVLAVTTLVLSFASGEVNDRLWADSSVMTVFAGSFFLLFRGGGPTMPWAVVAPMSLLAALSFHTRGDIRNRQWFRAVANFGQLGISGLVTGVVVALTAEALLRSTTLPVFPMSLLLGSVAGVGFTFVNIVLVRIGVRALHGRRAVLPWSGMLGISLSLVGMGVIGAFLGALFAIAEDPVVVPLTLVVVVAGQLVFTSMARLRVAHESAISGFVKTLEARDLYTRGHTEKVAEFCQIIGEQLRLSEGRQERLRWAALIHDVGKLAVGSDLMSSPQQYTDAERAAFHTASHRVDDLLCEVAFLRPMVEISSGFHPAQHNVEYGQVHHRHDRVCPTIEQSVLAVADAFDAMTSSRSYRMAISQAAALDQLRRSEDPLFDPAVVQALEQGLHELGREYGPPEIDASDEAIHLG